MNALHLHPDETIDQPRFWELSLAFLRLANALILGSSAAFLIVLFIVAPGQMWTVRGGGPVVLSLMATAALVLLFRGRIRAAVYVFCIGLWAYTTGMSLLLGGLNSIIIMAYPMIIMVAGWLLGTRAAVVIAALTMAACFGFFQAELAGVLPPRPPTSPTLMWIVDAGVFALSALLITSVVRSYRNQLEEVRKLGSDLALRSAEVQAREAELNQAQAVAHVGSWVCDMATDVMRLSAETCRILGLAEDTTSSRDAYLARVLPEDRAALDGAWEAALKGGAPVDNEHRILLGETVRWVRQRARLKFGADGTALRAVGTLQDITERKRTEDALREGETRYRDLFEANPQPMWVFDLETLMFLAVNNAAVAHYGYARDEFLAMRVTDIRSPEQATRVMQRVAEVRKEDVREAGLRQHRRKDGKLIDVEITAHTLDFGGRRAQIVHVNDVTEKLQAERKLRESEQAYRTMFDSAPEGVWMIGPDRRTTEVNQRMCDLLGYAREDMLGRDPIEFADEENGRVFQANARRVPSRQTRTYQVALRHRDGHNIPTEFDATDLFNEDGSLKAVLAFVVDRSDRKRHEEDLQRLNEELEQRVVARTHALEAANNELEAFSYSVSHDLRAPLRAIHGFSRMVETQYAGRIDEQGREMLGRVSAGAQKMGVLIDDLLRLSRISRQAMRTESVDLSVLAWEVAGELHAEAPERRVEWVIAPQMTAEGDPGLLRVALYNLLGNAWKYSSRRELARIEFGVSEKDCRAAFFVRDNGAGFDMAQAQKLFSAFQRLHPATEFPGTGIGLATVARAIRRQGGEVWAEGCVGKGATFYFSLGSNPAKTE